MATPPQDLPPTGTGAANGVPADQTGRAADPRLWAAEVRLAQTVKQLHAGIFEIDLRTGQTFWSDENFRLLGVEPGTVVVIDAANPGKLKASTRAYDKKVAGIVSGANGIQPGISMIQEDKLEAGENVALSGRVFVKADTSAGPIEPGDLLTTSSIAGRAMKAADHSQAQGAILGKAMTPLQDGDGMVLVLVTLQ